MSQATKQDVIDFINACEAIHEAIIAAGDRGVPSGHMYAAVMSKMSLSVYERIIGILVNGGFVKNEGYLLTSITKTSIKTKRKA